MKKLIYTTLSVLLLSLSSCKKEDLSGYAKKEDLNDNKIENISITIQPSDWTWNNLMNQWQYSYYHGSIGNGTLIGFIMSINGKEAMPYYNAQTGVTFGLTDDTATGKIYVTYYNGTSSLNPPSTQYVYLKIIPSQLKKTGLDYSDFEQVNKIYN